MTKKILVLTANLTGNNNSVSYLAAKQFIANHQELNKDVVVNWKDLNEIFSIKEPLNPKNLMNELNSELATQLIEELKNVDKIVIATGMYNFNIPTTLKAYFDLVLQANKTFKYKYKGKGTSEGLLTNIESAQLILAQGASLGWYTFSGFENYLNGTLNFAGITKVNTLILDGMKTDDIIDLPVDQKVALFTDKIKKAATNF